MHDIKAMRGDPQGYAAALARRIKEPADNAVAILLKLDEMRREAESVRQTAQATQNQIAKTIGALMREGRNDEANEQKAAVADLKAKEAEYEAKAAHAQRVLTENLLRLPNLPADDVPTGDDEKDNVQIDAKGTPKGKGPHHADFAPAMGMDFEAGVLLAGTRFTVLRGAMARLQRALGQFMLDVQTTEQGYEETAIPVMAKREILEGTGQLPKFEDDLFVTKDDRWLIPTAEVGLTNLVRDQIVDLQTPMRLTALTQCFRAEAGAAGRDTRGYIRQHQFEKVELVAICREEDALKEHAHMLASAQRILDLLGLPYRTMLLCDGDMGFAARKTYDLEVWMPGQDSYREIASISWCGDFQGRRMNARYRGEDGATRFVHTLNGSGLAVGRTLVALIENNLRKDGSVLIPKPLQPYMGGATQIR